MKFLVLFIVFLATYLQAFSQNADSVPKKQFEYFFGCDCCTDTIVVNAGPGWKYNCTLYKSSHLLSMSKNGKVLWKRDLKELFEGKNPEGFCVSGFGEKWDDYIVVSYRLKTQVIFYVKTGRKVKKLKKMNKL